MEKIYKVTTEGDQEGKTTKLLGFCTGNIEDIKMFFNNEKYYSIYVDEVNVKHISKDMGIDRANLHKRKLDLEKELDNVKKQLL